MNKSVGFLLILALIAGCSRNNDQTKRIPLARAGKTILYYDEVPRQIKDTFAGNDSTAILRNYINKWARRELLFQRAEANLSPEIMNDINGQLTDTRHNLVVYEYQRMMMLEKMDTLITDGELEGYYAKNQKSFMLSSNIVKAVFIRLPVETPNIWRIRSLARSKDPKDFQDLQGLCFQFAEKFDDFNDDWITLDRLSLELGGNIPGMEDLLRRSNFYERNDSTTVSMIAINDYRLRGTLAPFEYVRDDIKRMIWNNRRIEFIQSLENGIYNEALQDNGFKIFEK
jgi:hypothetical protein